MLFGALSQVQSGRPTRLFGLDVPMGALPLSIVVLLFGVAMRWVFALHDHSSKSAWEVDLQARLFRALLREPARQSTRSVGSRMMIVQRFPSNLAASAEMVFRTPMELAAMLAGVAIGTDRGGWITAIILLPLLAIVFLLVPRLLELPRRNENAARAVHDAAGNEVTVLQEQLEATDHLEGCGLEDLAQGRQRASALALKRAERGSVRLGLEQSSIASMAVLLLPVLFMLSDYLPAGVLAGGGAMLVLFPQLQGAMNNLGNWTQSMRRLGVTVAAIEDELRPVVRARSVGTPNSKQVVDMLALRDVSITIPTGRLLLERVNCEFRRGEVHVICGPGGRGKSVLLDVIAGRFAGQVSGEFALDGASRRWSEWLGMSSRVYRVPQVPRLLRMTVREYVEFGSEPGASSGRAGRGLELLRDVLGERSQGPEARRVLETDLIGGDRRLSGFQSQILRLAQVMGLPPRPVLCLDEPDSSMSAEDAALVQQVIADRLASESIVLVASHRPASYPIARARIWFIARDGILSGTHAELLERSQEYRDYNQTGAAD